ncbi:MAG: ATP-binding protein [Phormidesmis sp.]
MPSEPVAIDRSERSLWSAVVDPRPLTASSQTKVSTVLKHMVARPEASCVLVLYRHKVVGIATRLDVLQAISQTDSWAYMRLSALVKRPVITLLASEMDSETKADSEAETSKTETSESRETAANPEPLRATSLEQLLELFEQKQISHLPVVDLNSRLLGIIHRQQLLQTLHHQRAEAQLSHPHHRAQLVSEITFKIRQSLQLKEILHTTVDEVQRLLNADRVLVYQVLPDGTGKAISEAVKAPYPSVLDMAFPEEVFPKEYQELYTNGRVRSVTNVHGPDSGLAECLVEFVEQWGIQSKLIVPIVHPINPSKGKLPLGKMLWGLLIAHQCDGPRQWSESEQDLMQQLAGQISLAFSQGQLFAYLEDRVRLRTAELTAVNASLQKEIQERQIVDAALRQSESQLRLITNHLPVLIAYVDNDQRYRFNNQVYEQWLGKSPAQIAGCSMEEVMGEAYYQKNKAHIAAVLLGEQVSYESELTFKSGRSHSVTVTYVPHIEVNNPGNNPTNDPASNPEGDSATSLPRRAEVKGFFALTTDISDRKAVERMKDEFIAVVSHELRTPLTSIHTSLKLLATGRLGNLSDDGQQMLAVADENTDRLVRLVNNVLDLQRIESGEVTIDACVCDMADLLRRAAEAMQTMAQQHEIVIQAKSAALMVWAEPDYIIRTLTNLIGNAIKFSAPNTIIQLNGQLYQDQLHQRQFNQRQSTRGGANQSGSNRGGSEKSFAKQALFQVKDNGCGIPANKLTKIFERFQQVDSSNSREKGGTGLGLTICRKIVEQHGGEIWAESHLGEGSSFYFTVPLAPDL